MRWTLALQDYDLRFLIELELLIRTLMVCLGKHGQTTTPQSLRFCLKKGEMSGSPDIHRTNYTRTVVLCLILVHQFLTLLTELAPLSCIALLKPMGHLCDCVSLCVCKDFTSCLGYLRIFKSRVALCLEIFHFLVIIFLKLVSTHPKFSG